jgi:caa(3)-type oxidase subunit IV
MNAAHDAHASYVTIWVWLVALLGIGMAVFFVPIGKTTATTLILGIAVVKAVLVGRHYMHLRAQPPMLYAIIGVPLLLAIGLVVILLPDIALR